MWYRNRAVSPKFYTVYLVFLSVFIGIPIFSSLVAPGTGLLLQTLGGGLSAGLSVCFFILKRKQKMIFVILVLTLSITAVIFIGWQGLMDLLSAYSGWLWGRGIQSEYRMGFAFANLFFSGFLFVIFGILADRLILLKESAGVGLAGYLILCMATERPLHKVTICLILLYIVSCVTERLQDQSSRKKATLYLLPFLLLFFMGLTLFPHRTEPYDWQAIRVLYDKAEKAVILLLQRVEDLFGSDDRDGFGLPVSGFSGTGRVGGDIFDMDKDVMQLSLNWGKRINIYLTGNIFDTFDGEEWGKEAEFTEEDSDLDLLETMYAVWRYDSSNIENYLYPGEATIQYSNLNTEYLFAPLKTRFISEEENWKSEPEEQGGQWTFERRQGVGTGYRVSYYQMNLNQPFWKDMVEQEYQYPYGQTSGMNIIEKIKSGFSGMQDRGAVLEEQLLARSIRIKEQYTERFGLSDGVRQWVARQMPGELSSYELCKELEKLLSGQGAVPFTYTLTPGEVPEGRSFLDYFLLESREGYCTYYATAFVLLVREYGMPARYVQGYCVNHKKLGLEEIRVTSGMGHAWPEVYFEGVGWIPFEPTPGYGNSRYRYWSPTSTEKQEMAGGASALEERIPSVQPTLSPVTPGTERERKLPALGRLILLTLGSTVGIMLVIERRFRKRRYSRYSERERMLAEVKYNLKVLRLCGFCLQPGETLGELRERILTLAQGYSLHFIIDYELIYYGKRKVNDAMIKGAIRERMIMLETVRAVGKWNYIWLRMRLLLTEGVINEQ